MQTVRSCELCVHANLIRWLPNNSFGVYDSPENCPATRTVARPSAEGQPLALWWEGKIGTTARPRDNGNRPEPSKGRTTHTGGWRLSSPGGHRREMDGSIPRDRGGAYSRAAASTTRPAVPRVDRRVRAKTSAPFTRPKIDPRFLLLTPAPGPCPVNHSGAAHGPRRDARTRRPHFRDGFRHEDGADAG